MSAGQGMPPRQTMVVVVLTMLYLVVELAFNARLLDVAGGLDTDAVHGLENFGRALSGTAVALFVFQYLLTKRASSIDAAPRTAAIVFCCLLSAVITFAALKLLLNVLVDASSGRFRKAAATLVVVRGEMIKGKAQLDGLVEHPALFERPEGKAFAALFPLLGVQIWDRVDQRLAPVKHDLVQRALDDRFDGPEGFYNGSYSAALDELRKTHRGELPQQQLQALFEQEFDKAWGDYVRQLRQHKWTPDTVPYGARRRVVADVRRRVNVPRDWTPSDRAAFRTAVEQQVVRRLRESPGTVYDNGRAVVSGLSWPAYVAHPIHQVQLRQALRLPSNVPVRSEYGSGKEFQEQLYLPMLRANVAEEMACLELAEDSFLPGGANQERGREAAQAVIASPLALLCSLLGAIAHIAKLLYQASRLVVLSTPRWRHHAERVIAVPIAVLVSAGLVLALLDNAITTSRVHRFMREQALSAPGDLGQKLWTRTLLGLGHAVEIGQGYGYPVNHFVRTRVLGGFDFNPGGDAHEKPPIPGMEGQAGQCQAVRASVQRSME